MDGRGSTPKSSSAHRRRAARWHSWSPAVTTVNISCPYYLHLDDTFRNPFGIGHALMQFVSFMAVASRYKLTAIARFELACATKTYHPQDRMARCIPFDTNSSTGYFFGEYFGGDIVLPPNRTSLTKWWLTTRLRAHNTCNVAVEMSRHVFMKDMTPKNDAFFDTAGFRAAFRSQHGRAARLALWSSQTRPDVRIAVHIRRGDALSAAVADRLTPNSAFLHVVGQVMRVLKGHCSVRPWKVIVVFVVEGGRIGPRGRIDIPDVDGAYSRLHGTAPPAGWPAAQYRMKLESGTVLDAFEALCWADVSIGGRSGFVQAAAYLCEAPVFLVAPFWHSYAVIPNALEMRVLNSTKTYKIRRSKKVTIHDKFDVDEGSLQEMLGSQTWC